MLRGVPVMRCSGVAVFGCSGVPVFLILVHAVVNSSYIHTYFICHVGQLKRQLKADVDLQA